MPLFLAQGRPPFFPATSWGAGAAVSQGNIPGPPISRYPWGAGSWPSTSWAGLSAAVSLGAGGQSCLPFFAQGRPPFFPATSLGGPAVYPRAGSWRGGILGRRLIRPAAFCRAAADISGQIAAVRRQIRQRGPLRAMDKVLIAAQSAAVFTRAGGGVGRASGKGNSIPGGVVRMARMALRANKHNGLFVKSI